MRHVLATLLAVALAAPVAAARPEAGSLGEFETHADVGAPKLVGAASYNAVSQEYALSAAGQNMWERHSRLAPDDRGLSHYTTFGCVLPSCVSRWAQSASWSCSRS